MLLKRMCILCHLVRVRCRYLSVKFACCSISINSNASLLVFCPGELFIWESGASKSPTISILTIISVFICNLCFFLAKFSLYLLFYVYLVFVLWHISPLVLSITCFEWFYKNLYMFYVLFGGRMLWDFDWDWHESLNHF